MEGMTTPLQGWQNDSLSPLLQDSELLHCPMDEAKNVFLSYRAGLSESREAAQGSRLHRLCRLSGCAMSRRHQLLWALGYFM